MIMKQLAPSLHMLEIFMPAVTDENFFVQKDRGGP